MSYATPEDLTEYLEGDPQPDHPQRLLNQATDDINDLLFGMVYDVDEDGNPTNAAQIEALKQACILQALFVAPDPDGKKGQYSSMATSSVSWTRATDAAGNPIVLEFSRQAWKKLRRAGLLKPGLVVVGRG